MPGIYHWVIDGTAPFDALTEVLDYCWEAELRDYEASLSKAHTFEHLVAIANWLNSGADWTPSDYLHAKNNGLGSSWRASATYDKPGSRVAPEPGTPVGLRFSFPEGDTLDVTEAAKAVGLSCPVSV